tara:strand:+ start:464 stop:679 length:216 start_codon:yes stop_codon:yes gene_type:complete
MCDCCNIIKKLIKQDGMMLEEAIEFYDYNLRDECDCNIYEKMIEKKIYCLNKKTKCQSKTEHPRQITPTKT